jgi:hypothetical protein
MTNQGPLAPPNGLAPAPELRRDKVDRPGTKKFLRRKHKLLGGFLTKNHNATNIAGFPHRGSMGESDVNHLLGRV